MVSATAGEAQAVQVRIKPVATTLAAALQETIDHKTKPLGALGRLEPLALQLGLIQNTLTPVLRKPAIIVCAGDHGATAEGISAYPSAVTAQMVLNFLAGGAAINVFARQHGIELLIVDAGVACELTPQPGLIDAKIAFGTNNYVHEPAMSAAQCERALQRGAEVVTQLHGNGSTLVGFGEMGIGNSASAALLMALLCQAPLARCTGAGAGLDSVGLARKIAVLERARERIVATHGARLGGTALAPLTILAEAGGLEIAMLCGSLLRAAELGLIILVDGFIVSAAVLVASRIDPMVLEYCVFSHRSDESGHGLLLQQLRAEPLLDLGLRLGEGSGAALAYPLVQAAALFLSEMASFEQAGVSARHDG